MHALYIYVYTWTTHPHELCTRIKCRIQKITSRVQYVHSTRILNYQLTQKEQSRVLVYSITTIKCVHQVYLNLGVVTLWVIFVWYKFLFFVHAVSIKTYKNLFLLRIASIRFYPSEILILVWTVNCYTVFKYNSCAYLWGGCSVQRSFLISLTTKQLSVGESTDYNYCILATSEYTYSKYTHVHTVYVCSFTKFTQQWFLHTCTYMYLASFSVNRTMSKIRPGIDCIGACALFSLHF